VLDARGRHPSSLLPHVKRSEYEAGHIPGAVFVDWEHDFTDPDDPVPVQLAGTEGFAARAGALGIGDGDLIVTYDDYYGIFAGRVAWAFRYYGAEARVLDGGWTTWLEEARAVGDEPAESEPQQFAACPGGRGKARPRSRDRPRSAAPGADRDLRQRRLGNGRAVGAGADRSPLRRCL
jgi:3-mercaptopyruvate sulfurtransferase SseA